MLLESSNSNYWFSLWRNMWVAGWTLVAFVSLSTEASYHPYHYDMTVPQFTPDGRLLQVEYASEAIQHSAPLIVARLLVNNNRDNDSTTTATKDSSEGSLDEVLVLMTLRSSAQQRLIVLPPPDGSISSSTDSDTNKGSMNVPHVVLGMSGVLSDSLALLQAASQEMIDQRRQFGQDESDASLSTSMNSPIHVAASISRVCQQHAFGGGLRPYGSTILVCGCLVRPNLVRDKQHSSLSRVVVFQIDPSGAVQELLPSHTTSKSSTGVVFLGGSRYLGQGSSINTAIKRKLDSCLHSIQQQLVTDNKNAKLANALSKMAKIVLEESSLQTVKQQRRKRRVLTNEDEECMDNQEQEESLEIVIISSDRGVYKLSQMQTKKVIAMR